MYIVDPEIFSRVVVGAVGMGGGGGWFARGFLRTILGNFILWI